MKKVFVLAVFLAFSIYISVVGFAQADGNDAAFESNKLSEHSEAAAVLGVIDNSNARDIILDMKSSSKQLIGLTPDSLAYGTPYKVMIASDKDIIETLSNNKKVMDLVKNSKYYWEVPIIDKNSGTVYGSFTVEYLNGEWAVNEVGGYLPADEIQTSSDNSKIAEVLNNTGLGSTDSFVHLRIPSIHKDYLISSNKDGESFIALKDYKDKDSKLSKTKLTPNDFMAEVKNLSTYIQNNQDATGKYTGGSSVVNEKSNTMRVVLYTTVSLLGLALAAFLVVRKLRKGNVAV